MLDYCHIQGLTAIAESDLIPAVSTNRMNPTNRQPFWVEKMRATEPGPASASCAISGSGKRGCACIAASTRRAKRPSIRGSTTTPPDYDSAPVMAFSCHLERPAVPKCASRIPC